MYIPRPALILQAQIKSAQGKHNQSAELFKAIYEVNKNSLSATTYYAEELGQLGDFTEARKVLRRAVRKFPKNIRFYEMLSHAEDEAGSKMESHRALAEAYALIGNYQLAVQQLKIARNLANKDNFYVQASITAKIKELKARQALEKNK